MSFKGPFRDKHSWIKFNERHICALRNPFRDGWESPLLARGSCVLHQTQICGITLREPSHKWISCCVWSLIGESVHHVAICLRTSSLLSHFPRNQHPAVWVTLAILSSAFIYLFFSSRSVSTIKCFSPYELMLCSVIRGMSFCREHYR